MTVDVWDTLGVAVPGVVVALLLGAAVGVVVGLVWVVVRGLVGL